jgi:hypothetical protein
MEMSRTPSSIAKISRWTFASQAIADAYSFVGVSVIPYPVLPQLIFFEARHGWDRIRESIVAVYHRAWVFGGDIVFGV